MAQVLGSLHAHGRPGRSSWLSTGPGNMSRLHNSIEPRVMDDEMLKLAVSEQGPREEAGQLAKQEGILFKDVLTLRLDFQNILHIDNLWQFENLRKLQLDNNIIERIEGLENLVHLVWLDLSFNNIEVIEGLDSLVNLEDLSLFNNRISRIDSLDALGKLQVLSLGNNQIDNIMNLVYLRRFKCLRTLSLAGNPIAQAEDYKMFIYAYLPDLVYLDFRRIGDHMAQLAEAKHQYSTDELKHREHLAQARLEAEQAQRAELEAHKAAFVDRLNDSFLFDSMYAEDVEGNKLSYLPGVGELLETYKDKFVTICVNIFEYGLKQQEKRKIELDTFTECIQEAIQENQEQGKLKIAQFEEKHSLSLSNIREASELPTAERIAECDQDITELFNALMTLEMQLAEQLEETISMFERNIVDLVGLFIENVQSLYPSCCGPGGTGQPRPAVLGPLLDSRRDDGAVSGPGEPPPREAAGDLHQHPGEDGQGRAGRGPARRRASGECGRGGGPPPRQEARSRCPVGAPSAKEGARRGWRQFSSRPGLLELSTRHHYKRVASEVAPACRSSYF
nr:dynein regulatory complex subunit 3 isoform X2 [Oryctolagus cuniculus]